MVPAKLAIIILVSLFTLSTTLAVLPSPAEASFHQDLGNIFRESVQKLTPSPKPTVKPKAAVKPSPKPQVKGVSDKGKGQVLGVGDAVGGFFNGVGSLLDALWPFNDQPQAKKPAVTSNAKANASPSPVVSPSPETESESSSSISVTTGSDTGSVTVVDTFSKLTVTGNVTLGDAAADKLIFKGSLDSDLVPSTTNTYNLGSGSERFKGIHTNNLYVASTTYGSGGITFEGDATIGVKDGSSKSLRLDSDSGILYLAPGTNTIANSDNAQNILIDPNGTNAIDFHSSTNRLTSGGNLTIAGTLTTGTGSAASMDNLTLTPSTDIDALNVVGTNVATADLLDLDGDATTTGDAIDINMANTRTSGSAILITDASVAATVSGDLIQINVTGTPDTNTIDIDFTAAATGDAINITMGDTTVATQALVIDTAAGVQTASPVYINWDNTTGTVAAIDIDAAGTRGGVLDIDVEAALATEAVIAIDVADTVAATSDMIAIQLNDSLASGAFVVLGADGARTDAIIDITTATTGSAADAAAIMQINSTGVLNASANVLDINMSGGAASNVLDITTLTTAYTGNMIDLNFGNIADTGAGVDISMGAAAVDAQGLVISTSAGIRTSSAIQVTENNTSGTVATFNIDSSATRGGLFDIDTTGIWTDEHLIDITTGAQAWTANILDINVGAAASTGDVMNVDMGATNIAGGAFVVAAAGGARTDAIIDITTASTGSAADAAAIMQINSTGVLNASANVLDINMSGGAASNVIDITTLTTAFTGNLVDLNFGNIADTGAGVDISMGAAAVDAQGLVISTSAGIRTSSAIQVTENNTSGTVATFNIDSSATRGGLFDIDTTGIWTDEHLIDITTGAQAWTANILDINVGAAASTGDVMNVDMGATNIAGGAFVVAAAGGARTDAIIDITTASTGSAADAAAVFQINSTGDLDDLANVFDVNMSGGTGANVIDITTLTTASSGNLIDLNFGAITDTGDAINIAVGTTAVGAQALVVTDGTIKTADLVSITGSGATVATGIDLMSLAFTNGNGTDVAHNIINMLLTSGGTATTDIARGLFIDLASTAGGTDKAIEIENTAAWDIDIELQFDETINNATDDSVIFSGVGGTNNETFTIDLDSAASSGATLSSGGTYVLINDNLSVGIDGNTTENIASSDFAFSGNDLYVDDKFGVNGTASIDGNLWQGDAVTTTTKTTAFLFLGTTAGAPTGDPATPAGFAAIVWDTTNNKICAEEEAAGASWLCTGALTDVAEWMPAAGAESADLVSLTNLSNPIDDPTAPFMLAKSAKRYDNNLVGVISKYAEDAEAAQGYKLSPDYHAVTLVGRVPVKVSGENGAIAKGDYLTSSSTAGYAMKATQAGPVAGMALESFSGDKGTVMAFIKAAWFDPVQEQKRAVLAALGVGSVLGASTSDTQQATSDTQTGAALVGSAADGSLGVLEEAADLMVHGLLTAANLRVTTAATFEGTLVVKGAVTFEGDLVVKGAFATGSLDLSGALTKTMTAGSDISAGDPVAVSGANTVVRAGAGANVVGLAATSASAGASVKVAVAGTVGGYSGLSAGSRYYVGAGGAVTTAPGGDKAVHVGIAVSGSEMVVQIFESAAPTAPAVVDEATVDSGPTVTVSEGSTEASPSPSPEPLPSSEQASPSPEPSPSPSPEPSPSPAL